ncbi:hypothetical protein SK128_000224 [Halocaridina rubra]|uniref:Uncharacterized protein n=1 Tax=Halocaridina rubra TaxID=373956 RepID=A0AAN9A175_HALRR
MQIFVNNWFFYNFDGYLATEICKFYKGGWCKFKMVSNNLKNRKEKKARLYEQAIPPNNPTLARRILNAMKAKAQRDRNTKGTQDMKIKLSMRIKEVQSLREEKNKHEINIARIEEMMSELEKLGPGKNASLSHDNSLINGVSQDIKSETLYDHKNIEEYQIENCCQSELPQNVAENLSEPFNITPFTPAVLITNIILSPGYKAHLVENDRIYIMDEFGNIVATILNM